MCEMCVSDPLCKSTLGIRLTLSLFAVVCGASGILVSSPLALFPWQTHCRQHRKRQKKKMNYGGIQQAYLQLI